MFNSVKKYGLKLNRNKSQFNKSGVIFLGHKVTATGIYFDNRKVETIKNTPFPENQKRITTFLRYDKLFRKICP